MGEGAKMSGVFRGLENVVGVDGFVRMLLPPSVEPPCASSSLMSEASGE